MHYSEYRKYTSPISIQYYNKKPKKDIYLEILELLTNHPYIVFKTNITNISNIDTGYFELNFYRIEYGYNQTGFCYFKKDENLPLILICDTNYPEYDLTLVKLDKLNLSEYDININYNFIISYNKEEKIDKQKCYQCNKISHKYPEILDFTLNDSLQSLNLTMYSYQCEKKGITLNLNSPDLICETSLNDITRCIIPKSHFKGKKSGYFYIYHDNCENGKDIFYETSPLKVILPEEDNESDENNSKICGLSFILFVILFLF